MSNGLKDRNLVQWMKKQEIRKSGFEANELEMEKT